MSSDEDNIDYYQLLDVPRNASDEDIKRGYKKQALRWHPDKNRDNQEEAEKRFKLIAEAFEVLSDKSRRETYDRYGRNVVLGRRGGSDQGGAATDFSKYQFRSAADLFKEFFPDDPFLIGLLEELDSSSRQRRAQRSQFFDNFCDFEGTGDNLKANSYLDQSGDELFRAQFGDNPLYKQFFGKDRPALSKPARAGGTAANTEHREQDYRSTSTSRQPSQPSDRSSKNTQDAGYNIWQDLSARVPWVVVGFTLIVIVKVIIF